VRKTRYQLPVTRHWPLCGLLFPVDLRPNSQHDVAEEEGVEGDQRDVAAEVEGEDDADEEEEHAAGFFAFEVLSRQDRHPDRHQQSGGEDSEERPEIHHPLPDHPRRDRRPYPGLGINGIPPLPACDRVVDSDERLVRPETPWNRIHQFRPRFLG
jgi:hypothetical protein